MNHASEYRVTILERERVLFSLEETFLEGEDERDSVCVDRDERDSVCVDREE